MKLIVSILGLLSLLYSTKSVNIPLEFINNTITNNSVQPLGIPQGASAVISCTCDGRTLQEDVSMESLKSDFENIDVSKYCEKNATALCEFSRMCDNCTFQVKNCSSLSEIENSTSGCFYKNVKVPLRSSMIKTKITGPYRNRRDLYLTGDCLFPSELKTAELNCLVHPKYIKCRQSCIFGYTLEEGISREVQCYYKDKKWSGRGFKECLPFVDCTLTLLTGGTMSCEKNTVQKPPHCNVSCTAYEDKPATPLKMYTCTTKPNKWSQDLPHCVSAGSGFDLVPAPRIKDHSKEIFEPEMKPKRAQPIQIAPKPQTMLPDTLSEKTKREDANRKWLDDYK